MFYGLVSLKGGDCDFLLSEASKIILNDELEQGALDGRDDVDVAKQIIRKYVWPGATNNSRPLYKKRQRSPAGKLNPSL